MNNQWQDNLRDRMERHEEPAPDGLWNDIEQLMSAGDSVSGMSTDLKTRMWGRRIGVVAAVALILFFIGLYTWRENQLISPIEELNYSVQSIPSNIPIEKEVVVYPEKLLFAHESEVEETIIQITFENDDKIVVSDTIEKRDIENSYENNDDNSYENNYSNLESNDESEPQLIKYGRKRKSSKWQTDVYASNISSGASYKHDGFGSLSPYGFPSDEEEFVFAAIRSDTPEEIEVNKYKYVYTDIKHSQPIMLGVSLKYNLDNNWSITSGLTYTILSSQLRSGNQNHYYESQQSLHYIGVPINVNYTIWRNNKLSTYISGGGLIEKNVMGSLATDYYIDNKIETSDEERISIKQLQYSVNSAIGVQYQLSEKIGLYSEPGVAYHFKNKGKIETIYKEKPLNFNIRFGLRFTLND